MVSIGLRAAANVSLLPSVTPGCLPDHSRRWTLGRSQAGAVGRGGPDRGEGLVAVPTVCMREGLWDGVAAGARAIRSMQGKAQREGGPYGCRVFRHAGIR